MSGVTLACWLIKSEPSTYSIDDLKKDGKTSWDGVRNYQARNFMRDGMKKGDLVLFYHSNAEPPGVAGVCRVVKEGYPDPKDTVWSLVDVEFVEKLKRFVALDELKANKSFRGCWSSSAVCGYRSNRWRRRILRKCYA